MAIRFGDAVKGFAEGQEFKQKKRASAIDALLKEQQLAEQSGPVPEGFVRFGGKTERDPSYVTPYQRRRMDLMGRGDTGLTAGQRTAKDKATQELFGVVEQNKLRRGQIADARTALPNAPQGLFGKIKVEYAKRFNPTDPMLADWQKIKTIGTDAQLLNTARTKGAISDKEMALFATAAANDDLISAPRLKPILDKIEASLAADENAKFGAYQKNYGEDPRQWFGQQGGGNEFNSPEEADASGLPPGTRVTVQGRPYQI